MVDAGVGPQDRSSGNEDGGPGDEPKSRRRNQTLIGAKYALGDDLGRGSSGRVFKALNTETGDFAAIKEIALQGISDARLHGIEMEINMLRTLSHPRIVQYHECITSDDALFIVLEYVENGSMSDILRKFGRLPEQLVIRYIAQVLEALDFLHGRGVVHRDIKGANILVTKDGHVKLADFGVARLTDEQTTKTQSVVGTPYWMAPEIIEMSAFTTASDIWSVGCTVIELLTGVPPYFALTQMSALYHIVNDDHPPLPEGLSEDLRDFLMSCFVKDVNARARASELCTHPWLAGRSRSNLCLGDEDDDLPDFMTHTVDQETSWLSSNGTINSIYEAAPGVADDVRKLRRGGSRSRIVGSDSAQRRLAAAAGSPVASPPEFSARAALGSPEVAIRVGTDAERVSPSAPFRLDVDPPLCGFLWKRGTSALGKLAYYKRYFYIKEGALCYCSGRTDSTIQQSLEKRIPLTSISSVHVGSAERFEFHMRCDSRVYQFRSRTLREMHVWVATLQALQQRYRSFFAHSLYGLRQALPMSLHEGEVQSLPTPADLAITPAPPVVAPAVPAR